MARIRSFWSPIFVISDAKKSQIQPNITVGIVFKYIFPKLTFERTCQLISVALAVTSIKQSFEPREVKKRGTKYFLLHLSVWQYTYL